ncbi:MAG: cellulase family glycosylhydrolase, partial [Flavobacteriales bacterium]|nr:cellulase family glycosylhydrolase [Flavobacteriales bacterium]
MPGERFRFMDRDSCRMQLRAELALIRRMGFDAVRIVGLTERPPQSPEESHVAVSVCTQDRAWERRLLDNERLWADYLQAVDEALRLCEEAGLKVIPLATIRPNDPRSEAHFARVADRFRDDRTILAFDLFNEPLYFDVPARSKQSAHDVVKGWRRLAREHAPNHLITIGLTGIRETHAWDPNILDVDFISFHPYEYEPDQVLNEIRWYGTHVRTPWMIGETSLPADGDSVSYAEQSRFAERTLQQVRAYGGIGYSWWQFKDVQWGRFHSDYMGVVTQNGETNMPGQPIAVIGTVKPVAEVFQEFDAMAAPAAPEVLGNYLNYSEHRIARLSGRLVDEKGIPIEGGVVLAWDQWFSHSYHTTSRADGTFDLLGDMYFHHWIASAVDHAMVRDDCEPAAFRAGADGVPAWSLGDVVLRRMRL